MKYNAITILIFAFEVSFLLHILFLIDYISSKQNRDFYGFLGTAFTNISLAISMVLLVMRDPMIIGSLKKELIVLVASGILFIFMLIIKTKMLLSLFSKMRDPANYHYSFFGKKIYEKSIFSMKDLAIYFFTVPITVLSGAYFIVSLIRMN